MTALAMPASLAWRSLAAPLRGAQRLDAAPRIPGFRVLREIGTGRRSSAWLARELAGDREVVLKVQPASGSTLHREWSIAAQVAGPHVLQVHGHGRAGGWDYLVMEHASGGDLAGRMHGLASAEALALLAQCARGLAALHRAGLVHRDVKPANFLLRADGAVVLADFGLAVPAGRADASFSQGAVVGTPRYVAPEQLQGAPAAAAADVYGLGVLLFEMLCGRPPFGGETLMEILSQHLVAPPPRLAAAHARLQPLADALLAKAPAARPADADEVLGLLGQRCDRDPE